MNHRIILLLSLVILLLPVVTACSDDDDAVEGTLRPVGSISGRVIDVSLQVPLEGCEVTFRSYPFENDETGSGLITLKAYTDQDGFFFRDDIPSGEVNVYVKRDGYRTSDEKEWALSPGGLGEMYFEMVPGEDPLVMPPLDDQSARPPEWETDDDD